MQLKILFAPSIFAVAFNLGCTRTAPLQPENLVGNYVYHSADSGSPHDPDRLLLKADGTYVLEHAGPAPNYGREMGKWQIFHNQGDPEIMLDHAGYPVEMKHGKVFRLLIDNDEGWSYQKTD